jgi:uncharacterized OsmC-like protein
MAETHTVSLSFGEGYRARATFESVPGAPSLLLDEPPPLGGAAGPNAMDLLAAAIGNCLGASMLFCMQRSRAPIGGLQATITTHTARNEENRIRIDRVDVQLRVTGAEDAAKLARCSGLFEDFCTVTASIRAGVTVNVSVAEDEDVRLAGR